jgi:predicted anti-sigma-YlaC factor YlaD
VECKECTEFLFDYYDDEFDTSLKIQVNEHLGRCLSCQQELASISATMNFLKVNMLVLGVDSRFTEKVMYKIDLEEITTNFTKPMEGIGLVLLILTLGTLVLVGPTIIGLLMLVGNILLSLLSMAAVVFASFPLIQMSSSIILGVLLLVVTVYMRHMVLHDSV